MAQTHKQQHEAPSAFALSSDGTHRGFYSQEPADHHGVSREQILANLDGRKGS